MACYLYSESENQPAIPACNCHYAGQSCSFPILSSLPPDHHRPTRLLKGDKLRCANVNLYLHCNTIVQCRCGYVVSLATPTKAEPLYKVHTHAGPCNQFYDRGCRHLEVILEYFCLFTHIFFSFYRVSLSEVHCKQEQQRRRQHRYQFFVFFIRSRRSL